jgi:hypothetical protein
MDDNTIRKTLISFLEQSKKALETVNLDKISKEQLSYRKGLIDGINLSLSHFKIYMELE